MGLEQAWILPVSTFRVLSVEDIKSSPPPTWLIQRTLVEQSLGILYGYRGLGKSFVALDLAHRIGAGLSWFGYQTVRSDVLYVLAGEGTYGLRGRIMAWEEENSQRVRRVRYVTEPVILTDADSISEFCDAVESLPRAPALIILDTLSRCAGGIDENNSKDMARVVEGVDRIRDETGAAMLLVHHSTKPTEEGHTHLRGHSVLESAADTILKLDEWEDGQKVLLNEKQKEDAELPPLKFSLERAGESVVPRRITTTYTGRAARPRLVRSTD